MASTDLTRTHTVATADERKKHTFSAWIKLSAIGSDSNTFFSNRPSGNYRFYYMIMNSGGGGNTVPNAFYCYMVYNGSAMLEASGTRKLRDVNGWYHIVVRTDTTQAAAADRFRVYINGEQDPVTLHHAPDQNEELQVNRDTIHYIGEEGNGNGQFNGSMSHIHFCDGYSYGPDSFGSTDSTTGEWKINTSPSVSYGTNGFFILKNGNSVTDQSGNSHNWTVNAGTLTKTEDNPSNVFATLNSLNIPTSNAPTFENGNTASTTSSSGSGKFGGSSTLGMTSGKWYCEARAKIPGSSRNVFGLSGAVSLVARNNNSFLSDTDNSIGWYSADGTVAYNNSSQYTASSYANDDILMIAVDMDNLKVYLGKNGTWQNSGVPTSGSTGTGAITIAAASSCHDGAYFFCFSDDTSTSAVAKFEYNFGNGYFGTTAVSSAGTNASGIGIFEYDVPAGYTALCTKGLNL